jgi:hypothetical protein
MGLHHMTTKQKEAFTTRALMALTTAMADQNYMDAAVIVEALAAEYGIRMSEPMRT